MEIKDVQHFSGVKLNHRLRNALEVVLSSAIKLLPFIVVQSSCHKVSM